MHAKRINGQVVEVFIILADGTEATEDLRQDELDIFLKSTRHSGQKIDFLRLTRMLG